MHATPADATKQPAGIRSLFPPCGSYKLNLDNQAWREVSLPNNPSHWSLIFMPIIKKNFLQWMFCLYKCNWTLLLLYMGMGVWTILRCCPPWFLRLGLSLWPGPHILGYASWPLLFASPILGLKHTQPCLAFDIFMEIMVIKFRSSCLYIKHLINRNIPTTRITP